MTQRKRRFLGRSSHPIDPKGRMSLSKKFQSALDREDERPAGILCVEPNHGRCLVILNDEGFEDEMRRYDERVLDPTKGEDDRSTSGHDVQRDIYEFVTDFVLDSSGRLSIPTDFREIAGIRDEVIAIGINQRLEIWAKERFEERPRSSASPLFRNDQSAEGGGVQ